VAQTKKERVKTLDGLIDQINEQFGLEGANPVALKGDDVRDVIAIPCASPSLAYLTEIGGWPRGKMIELCGKEHAGKTSLALLFLLDCLMYERAAGGTRRVAFIDVEHRFNPEWAAKLGINVGEDLILLQPTHGEMATDMTTKCIESGQICAIVFDSIGAVQGAYSFNEFDDKSTRMGGAAAVMSRHVGVVAPLADLYNVTMCYLNQLRDDMAGFGRPITPGGRKVKHAMSLRVYIRPGKLRYYDRIADQINTETQVGFPMIFKTLKNSYGRWNQQAWSDFYSVPNQWLDHVGFDVDRDLQRLGLLTGVISVGGSWYSYGEIKEQGRDKFLLL